MYRARFADELLMSIDSFMRFTTANFARNVYARKTSFRHILPVHVDDMN